MSDVTVSIILTAIIVIVMAVVCVIWSGRGAQDDEDALQEDETRFIYNQSYTSEPLPSVSVYQTPT